MSKYYVENGRNQNGVSWDYFGERNTGDQWHGTGVITWSDGAYYFGEWDRNKRTGYGVYRFASGAAYLGHFIDKDQDGRGMYSFANGDYYYGEWLNNKRDGLGLYVYQNGDWFYGHYVNGLRHGTAIYYYAKTQKLDFKTYSNGNIVRERTVHFESGISEILYNRVIGLSAHYGDPFYFDSGTDKNGNRWDLNCQKVGANFEGLGCIQMSNSNYYFGEWKRNNKTGVGMFKFPTRGYYYVGEVVNSNFEGRGAVIRDDGSSYFCEFVGNKKNGLGFYFDPNGNLFFGKFRDDCLDGNVVYVSRTMNVQFCVYENNRYVSTTKSVNYDI